MEAEAIFDAIRMSGITHEIGVDFADIGVDEGVIYALARHIATSAITDFCMRQ